MGGAAGVRGGAVNPALNAAPADRFANRSSEITKGREFLDRHRKPIPQDNERRALHHWPN
jgi:hypothetical protein